MGRSELQYRKKKLKKRLGKIENNNYRKSKIYIEDQELIDFDEISYENEVAEFDWECKKVVIVDKLNPIVINEESNKFIDDLKNIWVISLYLLV